MNSATELHTVSPLLYKARAPGWQLQRDRSNPAVSNVAFRSPGRCVAQRGGTPPSNCDRISRLTVPAARTTVLAVGALLGLSCILGGPGWTLGRDAIGPR